MNLIKSEFYKLKKSTPFWICLMVSVILAAFLPFALKQAVFTGDPEVQDMSLSAVELFNFSYGAPVLTLITGIFTSIFVSGEFHNGTMKNYLSKGILRKKIFLSKFVVSSIAITVMFILYNVVILMTGTVMFGFDPNGVFVVSGFIGTLITLWLLFIGYTAVFVATSVIMRSNGAAIAINICLVTAFTTLLSAFDFLVHGFGFKLSNFWINEAVSNVTKLPLPDNALLTSCILGVIYIIIANVGGIMIFKKTDVK